MTEKEKRLEEQRKILERSGELKKYSWRKTTGKFFLKKKTKDE